MKQVIRLSNSELSLVKFFSEQRFKNQRRSNIETQKVATKKTDQEIDLIGAVGEYGMCKYLNIPMETDLSNNTDFGKDCKYRGQTLDVKTTYYPKGRLIFRSMKHFKADIAVLTVVKKESLNTVTICGFIDKNTFESRHSMRDLGYGVNLVVEQGQLLPISQLV